uniref:Uncharacterized protein n=1 Tax=Chromera velia CCMP2878 TaxID=1169474 RepID=A0A0G4HFE6_9ALVE|eukprot:Cvel_27014.t1-p1 / transcript=Cvel_27014.t1 / gene=Cvel_27014 / organism=Chromera_velia_CCMP2878 / gene_product=hypothetical protein / transcript_product=hypothetical protein / location=Cvel_scaffold3304:1441-1983(-) / protein_length=181 / sequence_SO=supercontig / SO=protein_coding / is_pseudo=false
MPADTLPHTAYILPSPEANRHTVSPETISTTTGTGHSKGLFITSRNVFTLNPSGARAEREGARGGHPHGLTTSQARHPPGPPGVSVDHQSQLTEPVKLRLLHLSSLGGSDLRPRLPAHKDLHGFLPTLMVVYPPILRNHPSNWRGRRNRSANKRRTSGGTNMDVGRETSSNLGLNISALSW